MASCFRSCLCPPVRYLSVTHLRLPVNASGSHPFAGLYTRASAYWHIYTASPSGLLARKQSSSTYKAKKNRLNKSNLFDTGLCFWGLPPPPSYSAVQTLQTQQIHANGTLWGCCGTLPQRARLIWWQPIALHIYTIASICKSPAEPGAPKHRNRVTGVSSSFAAGSPGVAVFGKTAQCR